MCTRRIFGLAVVALLTLGGRARAYTNQWAAHIDGGEEAARRVAEDYGFHYLGKLEAHSKAKRYLSYLTQPGPWRYIPSFVSCGAPKGAMRCPMT